MKLLTFHGPSHHVFEVPGQFTLTGDGPSLLVEDDVADRLIAANPHSNLTATPAPRRGKRDSESQPEAHEGEGQPTASTNEKE